MGNQISNPSNNDQFTDSLLGKEIKKIMMEKTVANVNDVKFFQDENKNKNIKINQLKACCVGAIGEVGQINSTLGIPFPAFNPGLEPGKVTCQPGQNCLMTKNVGFTIETNDKSQYCGSNMDAKSKDAKTCDALLTDNCAKQLYEQGCIKLSGKKNNFGKSLSSWNTKNPMCVNTIGGKPVLYTGGPECTCVNSVFGPVLNKGPSYKLSNKGLKNPYGLTDITLDFDDNNEDTMYSLNIFKQENMAMHPGILDNRCVAKKNFKTDTAYNMSFDRDVPIGAICIQQINLTDSNVGKAVFEGNSFENNCANNPSSKKVPDVTDDEDLRIAEEKRQQEIAQKKAESEAAEKRKKEEEDAKIKEVAAMKVKQEKEKEENEKQEKARFEKLAAEQQAKYAEEIKKLENEKLALQLADKKRKEEEEQKIKIALEEKAAKDKAIADEAAITEFKRKLLEEQINGNKFQTQQPQQNQQGFKLPFDQSDSSTTLYVGGAIGVIILLILLIIFSGSGTKHTNEEDD